MHSRREEKVLVAAHSRGIVGSLVGERELVSVTENLLCRGSGVSVRQTADAHSREQRDITKQGEAQK